jgi:predicted transposase/invertase (TIGR01784 family)
LKKGVNNKHDKFFKAMMEDRSVATDFLKKFLPAAVIGLIDFDTFENVGTSYITEDLNELFSDAIFKFKLNGIKEECYVSVLLEHKSKRDDATVFQVLGYLANGYKLQYKNKEPKRVILPVVYYHGKNKWKLRQLDDYFKNVPPILKAFLPSYDMVYIDLVRLSSDSLESLTNVFLRSALMVQRHSSDPNLLKNEIEKILTTLSDSTERNFFFTIIVYVLEVLEVDESYILEISEGITPNLKDKIMSTYDRLIEKGIGKGIERGIEQGIERGIEQKTIDVIKNCVKNHIKIPMISNITGLSDQRVMEIIKSLGL